MKNRTRVGIYLDAEALNIYHTLQEEDGFNFSSEVRKWLKIRHLQQIQPEI